MLLNLGSSFSVSDSTSSFGALGTMSPTADKHFETADIPADAAFVFLRPTAARSFSSMEPGASTSSVPQPGNWTVRVVIARDTGKPIVLDAPIVIEPAQR